MIQSCFISGILREVLQILHRSCSTAWPFSIFTRVFAVIKRLSEAGLISTILVSGLILSFTPAGNDKGSRRRCICEWTRALTSNRTISSCQYLKLLLRQVYCFTSESVTVTEVFLYAVKQWSVPKRLPTHRKHYKPATVFQDGVWVKHVILCATSQKCYSLPKLMLWLNQKMTHRLWRGVLLLLQASRFTKDKTGGKKSHRPTLKPSHAVSGSETWEETLLM